MKKTGFVLLPLLVVCGLSLTSCAGFKKISNESALLKMAEIRDYDKNLIPDIDNFKVVSTVKFYDNGELNKGNKYVTEVDKDKGFIRKREYEIQDSGKAKDFVLISESLIYLVDNLILELKEEINKDPLASQDEFETSDAAKEYFVSTYDNYLSSYIAHVTHTFPINEVIDYLGNRDNYLSEGYTFKDEYKAKGKGDFIADVDVTLAKESDTNIYLRYDDYKLMVSRRSDTIYRSENKSLTVDQLTEVLPSGCHYISYK